jgi:hypothetical protein
MSERAEVLAERIARGHRELVDFANTLSEADWRTDCPNEHRTVGVLIHHVASALPAELDLVKILASGQPITGVTIEKVDQMNAQHAQEHLHSSRQETLDLLQHNSALVVDAVRELSDAELDRAAPVSLHWDAPLTTQYFIEEHPLSHAYHHLVSIRAATSMDAQSKE